MQLGWIDFSPSDREKALGVLDLLSDHDQEHDPLGISSVERAFANFFFPGISTQLTRAKYFFLVPYQMIWLYENSGGMDEKNINKTIADMEKAYTRALKKNASENDTGIIGNTSCYGDGWVTRPPSSRYWTSLKAYQILKKDITIKEYKLVCGESKISTPGWTEYWYLDDELKKFYSKFYRKFFSEWYNSKQDKKSNKKLTKWYEKVSIKLTKDEGDFLKEQIKASHGGSLLAKILDNKTSFSNFADLKKGFAGLKDFIDKQYSADDEIRKRYYLALAFSEFIIVARTLYNIIINEDKPVNEGKPDEDKPSGEKPMPARANIDIGDLLKKAGISDDSLKKLMEAMQKGNIKKMKKLIKKRANINIDVLLEKAEISDGSLMKFLKDLQKAMLKGDIKEMKKLIIERAEPAKAGEIEKKWYGGKELEYRFNIAKNIINDIFESEGNENAGSEK